MDSRCTHAKRMASAIIVCFISLSLAWHQARAAQLLDPMKHDIFAVTGQNFNAVIGNFRNNQVAALLFYNKQEESRQMIDGVYNDLAKSLKGQVKIAAISCTEYGAFCQDNKVQKYPSIMIYPPNPMPAFLYEKEVSVNALTTLLMNLIPEGGARVLDSLAKHDQMVSENPSIPKVILFSDKKKAPPLYNSLVNNFKDRITFAFVESSVEALVKRYSIGKFPTIISLRGTPPKQENYKGDMKFKPLHEWLNIRSETFVKGGGFSDETRMEDTRIWLVQKVPEVTRASHQDICFKKQGLCVIYLTNGPIADDEILMLEKMVSQQATGDRGIRFRWMWMNMNAEPQWKEMFEVKTFPSVVVFNPHKRLRWTSLGNDEAATSSSIEKLLEKIAGGDARFTAVKEQKLPKFAERKDSPPTKEEL